MTDEGCTSRFFREATFRDDSLITEKPTDEDVLSLSQGTTEHSSTFDSSQNLSQHSNSDVDVLSLSQLTLGEWEPLPIPSFYNITPRDMPLSPHRVFEEELQGNPWAMLVTVIFLTKTAGKTARSFIKDFFEEFPTPYHVLDTAPTDLERFFETLGLRKRGHMIWKMSYQFVSARWRRASDLCGVGKYGEDAYRLFCLGHTDLEPTDRYLRLYLDWLRAHTDYLLQHGLEDSEFVIEDPVLKYYSVTLRDLAKM